MVLPFSLSARGEGGIMVNKDGYRYLQDYNEKDQFDERVGYGGMNSFKI